MKQALIHAGISVFVSSLTDGCSFLVNMISDITVLKCFSLFVGLCLFVNFFLMMLFIPAVLLIVEFGWRRLWKSGFRRRFCGSKFVVACNSFLKIVNDAVIKLIHVTMAK